MPRHFAAKAVVAQKNVANAGNQYARLGHNNSVSSFEFQVWSLELRVWNLGSAKLQLETVNSKLSHRFNLLRRKEEAMAGLTQHSQIAPRIIVKHYRQVGLPFIVLFDCFNHRHFPLEC